VQANVEADEEDRMPDEVVIANMRFVWWFLTERLFYKLISGSSIVLGGQETTSGAMSRLLDLMTLDPSLQTTLREEINEAIAVSD